VLTSLRLAGPALRLGLVDRGTACLRRSCRRLDDNLPAPSDDLLAPLDFHDALAQLVDIEGSVVVSSAHELVTYCLDALAVEACRKLVLFAPQVSHLDQPLPHN
jgi:hypothetical protein